MAISPPLPPELQALLGGAGGAPADPSGGYGGAPGPDPSQAQDPSQDQSQGNSSTDIVQGMIESAKEYHDNEPDEEDKLTMTKIMAQLQQLLAKDQKDEEQMLSGTVSPRAMRKVGSGVAA